MVESAEGEGKVRGNDGKSTFAYLNICPICKQAIIPDAGPVWESSSLRGAQCHLFCTDSFLESALRAHLHGNANAKQVFEILAESTREALRQQEKK